MFLRTYVSRTPSSRQTKPRLQTCRQTSELSVASSILATATSSRRQLTTTQIAQMKPITLKRPWSMLPQLVLARQSLTVGRSTSKDHHVEHHLLLQQQAPPQVPPQVPPQATPPPVAMQQLQPQQQLPAMLL